MQRLPGGPLYATIAALKLLRAHEAMEAIIEQEESRGRSTTRSRKMLGVVGDEVERLVFRIRSAQWLRRRVLSVAS